VLLKSSLMMVPKIISNYSESAELPGGIKRFF